MTPVRITGMGLIPLHLPMRRPFITAHGQKQVSHNLLVVIRLSDGTCGLGEASASLAWPQETQSAMSHALRPLTPRLIGSSIGSFRRLIGETWETAGEHPAAASALECALLDAFTRSKKIPLWRWCGGKRRAVTTALTISAWPKEYSERVARAAAAQGFRRFKVKITGHDPEEDIRRVVAVHRAAPKAALWIDANQGLRAQEAIHFALFIREQKLPVQLFEQPVPRGDWEGLAQVQREGKIPVAADESARSIEEVRRLIRKKIVSVINVKLAKSGFLKALQVIRLAKASHVRLMVGCMAESAIGISISVHLACGTGAFEFVDLDSHLLVVSPPCEPGFRAQGPRLSVHGKRSGTGVAFPV